MRSGVGSGKVLATGPEGTGAADAELAGADEDDGMGGAPFPGCSLPSAKAAGITSEGPPGSVL
jgi:hypothetical protein